MFVSKRMSRPVICVLSDEPINEVLALFRKEHIRRAPVIQDGKLVGIVSERGLLNASPSSLYNDQANACFAALITSS